MSRLEVSQSYVAISNDSKDQEKLHRRKAIKNLSKGEKRGCCASFSQSQPASSPTTLRLVSRLSIHFHSEMQRLRRSCETWLQSMMDRRGRLLRSPTRCYTYYKRVIWHLSISSSAFFFWLDVVYVWSMQQLSQPIIEQLQQLDLCRTSRFSDRRDEIRLQIISVNSSTGQCIKKNGISFQKLLCNTFSNLKSIIIIIQQQQQISTFFKFF